MIDDLHIFLRINILFFSSSIILRQYIKNEREIFQLYKKVLAIDIKQILLFVFVV